MKPNDTEVTPALLALLLQKRVLTFREGCTITGTKPSYMYKLTARGEVPYSKPNGKRIFFDREKLENWMLSNSHTSSNEKDIEAATYVNTRPTKKIKKAVKSKGL